jgi:hypothetical protein
MCCSAPCLELPTQIHILQEWKGVLRGVGLRILRDSIPDITLASISIYYEYDYILLQTQSISRYDTAQSQKLFPCTLFP